MVGVTGILAKLKSSTNSNALQGMKIYHCQYFMLHHDFVLIFDNSISIWDGGRR
jgi:hypothetical protein